MTYHLAKATSMDAFLGPQPADTDSDADSDATECPGSKHDEDSDVAERAQEVDVQEHARGTLTAATTESPRKKRRVSEEQPGDAVEHADYSEEIPTKLFHNA